MTPGSFQSKFTPMAKRSKTPSYPALVQLSILHPIEYAQTISNFSEPKEALLFFIYNFSLGFLIRILTNVLINKNLGFFFLGVDSLLFALPGVLLFLLILVLTFFLISKTLKGRASLSKQLIISSYCSSPLLLLAWVPILSLIATLISLAILIYSFKIINSFSLVKAGVTILIPFMVTTLLLIILGLIRPLIDLTLLFH